jgi:hypothetical protein
MAGRRLFVAMDEILDAMETGGDDSPQFFLDLENGQIELSIDPMLTGEELTFDPDDRTRYVEIPPRSSRDDYAVMKQFVASLDEPDVRARLQEAITGKGAFGRFRDTLAGYPDLRARWHKEERDSLLAEALEWLAGLGIEPQYELRQIPAPQPAGRPTAQPGQAQVGLFDMLLLGGHKTELIDGRVRRVFVAHNAEQARKVFARLARELAEHHGLAWRKRMIEDRNDFGIERCHLSVSGRTVELAVEVSAAIWSAFADPGPGTAD